MAGLQLGFLGTPEYQRAAARARRGKTESDLFGALLSSGEKQVIQAGAAGAMKEYASLLGLSIAKKEREVRFPQRLGLRKEELGLRAKEQKIRSGFREKELTQQSERMRMMADLRKKGIASRYDLREEELGRQEKATKRAFPWQMASVGVSGLTGWQKIRQAEEERDWRRGMIKKFGLQV